MKLSFLRLAYFLAGSCVASMALSGCANTISYGDTGGGGGAGPQTVGVVSVAHSTGAVPHTNVATTGYYDDAVSTGYYPDTSVVASTGYYPDSAVSTGYYPDSAVSSGYPTNMACFPWYGGEEGSSVTSTTGVNVAVAVATGYQDAPPCPDVNVAQGYFESVCSATIVYGPGYFDGAFQRCCYPVSQWPCVDSSSTGYTSGSYSSSTY